MNASAASCADLIDEHPETWALVDFTVPRGVAELVGESLWSMGVLAIEERASDDGYVTLRTSLGNDPEDHIVRVCADFEDVSAVVVHLPKSVSELWRLHATATLITETVAIVPSWVEPPPDVTPVFIEPRDTFGLGNHPSTVLALRLALTHVTGRDTVFDFGCGSGVLAVGLSCILGNACDVYDIADSARDTVQENCRLNGITNVRWNFEFDDERYDVVLANILAPVLRAEAGRISAITRPGGLVVLSGMRVDQVQGVLDAYEGWTQVDDDDLDGWTCVALRKGTRTF